jgi:hypothetical protein
VRPTETDRSTVSNLTGEKIGMSIDAAATEHIMGVLTDLYEDREMAVIRELSTNARDAHVDAGNADTPIEIETPTTLRPVFVVRDFGVGLDLHELRTIFTRYGASTKRDSDDVTGMLGLGCKSPLTYTDQFTLVATKDGTRIHASVARNDRGVGELTVVHTERDASFRNGVEIQVPAQAGNAFADKAAEFFAYWPEGHALVNGTAPERIEGDWLVEGELLIAESDDTDRYGRRIRTDDRHKIVMGGVAYPAEISVKLGFDKRLIAFVPIGAVNFTPSREALMDTKRTRETLMMVEQRFKSERTAAAQRAVEGATTAAEALRAVKTWRELGADTTGLKWQDRTLPSRFDWGLKNPARAILVEKLRYQGQASNTCRDLGILEASAWDACTFVENFTPTKMQAPHRRKLEAHAGVPSTDDAFGRYVLLRGTTPSEIKRWVKPERIIDWADLRKLKPASTGTGAATVTATGEAYEEHIALHGYNYYVPDRAPLRDASELAGQTVFYFLPPDRPTRWGPDWPAVQAGHVRALHAANPSAVILRVTRNREEKFKRLVPHAQEGTGALKSGFDKWWNALSETAQLRLTTRAGQHWLGAFDPKAFDDPRVRAECAKLRRVREYDLSDSVGDAAKAWRDSEHLGRVKNYELPAEIVEAYPLADLSDAYESYRPGDKNGQHLVKYLNVIYNTQKKGR